MLSSFEYSPPLTGEFFILCNLRLDSTLFRSMLYEVLLSYNISLFDAGCVFEAVHFLQYECGTCQTLLNHLIIYVETFFFL